MKMVLGLLQPDEGEIQVCSKKVCFGQTNTNQFIGYLPDVPEFYNDMTPAQYLELCGKVIGLSKSEIEQRSQNLLALVGLKGVEKQIGGFSRGMKQRLGIAQALFTNPKLLISGVGFSAVIILYGSCLSGEYSKGTLVLMVTKGLSRKDVIFAKYTVAAVLMTISFWGSYAFTYGYTALLWPDTELSNVALAACALWIVGFLYLSILMVGCVLFKQTFTGILFTGGMVAVISLLGIIEPLAKFSPFNLTTQNIDLISGIAAPSDFIMPVLTSVAMSILGLLLAVKLFNAKAL